MAKLYKADVRKSQEETEDHRTTDIKDYACNCLGITRSAFHYKQVCIK